jgi:hypothetical protein
MPPKNTTWVYFITSLAALTTFGFPLDQTPAEEKVGFRKSGVDKT